MSKLTQASADLADKTVALEEVEAMLERERQSAQQLDSQVREARGVLFSGGAGSLILTWVCFHCAHETLKLQLVFFCIRTWGPLRIVESVGYGPYLSVPIFSRKWTPHEF